MSSTSDIFAQVRASVDIVDIIAEHVALKKAGREFKGLCPFHDDHRPSMSVVPHKQIFSCFVCGTAGDVFKFVREYHKMGHGEALRYLAQKGGVTLPELPRNGYGKATKPGEKSAREQIAEMNELACDLFEKTLRTAQGTAGLEYLHARGLTDETLSKFRLGMAPDSWTGLVNHAMRLSVPLEQLDQAGLVKKRQDGSPYDVFRNRVIFPIVDSTNRVMAFGGRVLVEKRDEQGMVVEAKYLNSPETRLFNKSESIYGLNHARQAIVRTRTAVVVEGYMDVISCHQAGVHNVIATLGTALTPEHARALKNYAQTIVLMFDSDDAGYRAADRALEVFIRSPLDIKIASVPDGKDPCDFCMKNGGEPFQKLIDNAVDAMTYQWLRLQKQFGATNSLSARQESIKQFMRFVAISMEDGREAQTMDPIRRGLMLSKISSLVGMSMEEVSVTLKTLARTENARAQVGGSRMNAGSEESGTAEEPSNSGLTPIHSINVRSLREGAASEAWVLGLLLADPTLYEIVREELTVQLFSPDALKALAIVLIEYLENSSDLADCSLADFLSHLNNNELMRQTIELETLMSDWLTGAGLSPEQEKLVKHFHNETGRNLKDPLVGAVRDLLRRQEIQQRSTAPIDDAAGLQAMIDMAKARNQRGGDPRRL